MFGTTLSFLIGLIPSGVKSYFIIFIVAVGVAFATFAGLKYKSSLDIIDKMEKNKISLEKEKAVLALTNSENQEMIKKMSADIVKRDKIVTDFKIQKARDDKRLANLSNTIARYDVKDDGPLAKVLKDTIISIQQDRNERLK